MSWDSFKNVIYKMCLEIIYLIYMYKKDLALHNLQWLKCQKTKSNQTKPHIEHCTWAEDIVANHNSSNLSL